jgi:acyl carrier protein
MDRRQQIMERVQSLIPHSAAPEIEFRDESALSDFGVNSFHLIAILFELKKEYGLGDEWSLPSRMPTTVGELVALVECGLPQTGDAP